MVTRLSWLKRIALFFGLALLAACTSRSSPNQTDGLQCGQGQPACNTISGYSGNSIAGGINGATIAGGGQVGAPNRVNGNFGTVGGGGGNTAGEGSTVAGGSSNTALYFHATVSGGSENLADAEEATVGGGLKNTASNRFATVGGGSANTASDYNATVGGGSGNQAANQFATVGGGTINLADNLAAVVAGGNHNLAGGPYSSIQGGINNSAQGNTAAIGGGAGNVANGAYAVVPGGFANQAGGAYSFAAGRTAVVAANDPGSFLFSDSNNFIFPSLAPNEFAVRATGGVRFITGINNSGSPLAGVRLSPGSGSWDNLSDSNAKAAIAPADERQVLEQLMSIPISTWNYKSQDPTIRHIGPMAEDFYAAFKVGQDGHYISTVDEEGVALASIQELYRIVFQKESGMQAPPYADSALQNQITALERKLTFSNGMAVFSFLTALFALWRRKKE